MVSLLEQEVPFAWGKIFPTAADFSLETTDLKQRLPNLLVSGPTLKKFHFTIAQASVVIVVIE